MTRGQEMGPARPRRSEEKSRRILEAALGHFARRGYQEARVEDIAAELGIAKGSVFQHFGSKEALFLAAYKRAVRSFSAYLDAPPEVLARGFFATLAFWLERTESLLRENWVPYRVVLLGNYATDLRIRREINRFLAAEDPYGLAAFVGMGIGRGEVRRDVDPEMIASFLDWTVERFQDALLTQELDPGLFSRPRRTPEETRARIAQFLRVLESALAAPRGPSGRKIARRGRPARPRPRS